MDRNNTTVGDFHLSTAIALRKCRLRFGISIAKAAQAADLPLKHLKLIEAGEMELDLLTMLTLCAVFGTTAAKLIAEAEDVAQQLPSNNHLIRSILTQQQLFRMERQHSSISMQINRMRKQVARMQGETGEQNPQRWQSRIDLDSRLTMHQLRMTDRIEQLRRSRQWCDENERFYARTAT